MSNIPLNYHAQQILDRTNRAINRGHTDSDITDNVVDFASYLSPLERINAINNAINNADDKNIYKILVALVNFISEYDAVRAANSIVDTKIQSLAFIDLTIKYPNSNIYNQFYNKLSAIDDNLIKRDFILKMFEIYNKRKKYVDDFKKRELLNICDSIDEPALRAHTLMRIAYAFHDPKEIIASCIDEINSIRSLAEIEVAYRDFINFVSNPDEKALTSIKITTERLRAVEMETVLSKTSFVHHDQLEQLVRADIRAGNADKWSALFNEESKIVDISLDDLSFLKSRAVTRNWKIRRSIGYNWDTSPVDFIYKEYKEWLSKGLSRSNLRLIDSSLSRRLDTWTQKSGNVLPDSFLADQETSDPIVLARREKERLRKSAYRAKQISESSKICNVPGHTPPQP